MRKTEGEEEGEREIGATDEAVLTANATIFCAIWERDLPNSASRIIIRRTRRLSSNKHDKIYQVKSSQTFGRLWFQKR